MPDPAFDPLADLPEGAKSLIVKRRIHVGDCVFPSPLQRRGPEKELLKECTCATRGGVYLRGKRALVGEPVEQIAEPSLGARGGDVQLHGVGASRHESRDSLRRLQRKLHKPRPIDLTGKAAAYEPLEHKPRPADWRQLEFPATTNRNPPLFQG